MRNKKIAIALIVLLLIAGTGTFVFAGKEGNFDEDSIDYRNDDSTYKKVDNSIKGQDVPVINNDNTGINNGNENTEISNPNEGGNNNNSNTTSGQTNSSGSSVISGGNRNPGSGSSNNSGAGNTQDGETTTNPGGNDETNSGDSDQTNSDEDTSDENEKFSASLIYSYTDELLTNQDITLTIMANKAIDKISDGWKKIAVNKAEKTFENNASGEVKVINGTDEIVLPYNVDKIDKIKLVATVSYSETRKTYHPIKVVITSDKPIERVSEDGWKYDDDNKQVITKTFERKVDETKIILEDEAKNKTEVSYMISNYDDSPITSTNKDANGNTTVDITYKEPIDGIDNWEKLDNGEYQATIPIPKNEDGVISLPNGGKIEYEAAPEITIDVKKYDSNDKETTGKAVKAIVTITSNKELQELDGWTLSKDKKQLTKEEISRKSNEQVVVYDISGNSSLEKYSVTNVDGIAPEIASIKIVSNGNEEAITLRTNKSAKITGKDWPTKQGFSFTKSYEKSLIEQTVIETIIISDSYGNNAEKELKIYYDNNEVVVEIDSKIMN